MSQHNDNLEAIESLMDEGPCNFVDGWWFSETATLPNDDGRHIRVGGTHKVEGTIAPGKRGLHLSIRPLDALEYAPGPIVWRVRGSGVIVPHNDKYACSERKYLAGGIDVSDTLWAFARACALDVIDLWDAPDIVVEYLKTADESFDWDESCLRHLYRLYGNAAGNAVRYAAMATRYTRSTGDAGNAAMDARYAARYARSAGDAAIVARYTRSADARDARYAARAAAGDKQNQRLRTMLCDAIQLNSIYHG